MDSPTTRALERELALDGDLEAEHLLRRHQLHPATAESPRGHILRSPSLNALAVAGGPAAASAGDDNDEADDETSSLLTHHEGLLKASILEKVQSEKRLRRLSFAGDRESTSGACVRRCRQCVCAYRLVVSLSVLYVPLCVSNWSKGGAEDLEELFEKLPEPYGQLSSFQRIQITSAPDELDHETKEVCELIRKCVALRQKWVSINEVQWLVCRYLVVLQTA